MAESTVSAKLDRCIQHAFQWEMPSFAFDFHTMSYFGASGKCSESFVELSCTNYAVRSIDELQISHSLGPCLDVRCKTASAVGLK